jgi:hypothetical protein
LRQLIVLAGAVAGRPQLFVLDDSGGELGLDRAIVEAIRAAVKGSILVVTERPETIAGADSVIYLDRRRTAQTAAHRDLLLKNAGYARLFNDFCIHTSTRDQSVRNRPHDDLLVGDDGRLWQPQLTVTSQQRIDLLYSASEVVRWSTRNWHPGRQIRRGCDVGSDPGRCAGPKRRGARQR